MRQPTVFVAFSLISLVYLASSAHAADEPTPESVIDRALKAGGGEEKISQFKAMSFKADGTIGKEKASLSGQFAGPTLFRLDADFKKEDGILLLVGSGDTVWVKQGKEPVKEVQAGSEDVNWDELVRIFYGISIPDQLLALKKKSFTLTTVGEQAANGVQTVVVRAKHELFPEALIFFDKETGLPVKTQLNLPAPKEKKTFDPPPSKVEVFFNDYKEVDGVQHFTKLKVRMGEVSIEMDLREIKLLKKIDSATFKKPE